MGEKALTGKEKESLRRKREKKSEPKGGFFLESIDRPKEKLSKGFGDERRVHG